MSEVIPGFQTAAEWCEYWRRGDKQDRWHKGDGVNVGDVRDDLAWAAEKITRLRAEVARLRITDAEREAIEEGREALRLCGARTYAHLLAGLLARAAKEDSR
jgi:hypothetical protein